MSGNTVVPLYINSSQRTDVNDSSSDYKIKLSKDLINIVSIDVSDVVIPKNDTVIDKNNNTLTGVIIEQGVETEFEITLTDGDYTESELAELLQTNFNENGIFVSYDFTWSITYDQVDKKMVIDILYNYGANTTWGILFNYSELIDVIGLGNSGINSQYYEISNNDMLNIPCNRSPNISSTMLYTITSDVLSSNINSSYTEGLSKQFDINEDNNKIIINTKSNIISDSIQQSFPTDSSPSDFNLFGDSVTISSDSNVLALNGLNGLYIYQRLTTEGLWVKRFDTIINDKYISLKAAELGWTSNIITMDSLGKRLIISYKNHSDRMGMILYYNRVGVEWTYGGEKSSDDYNYTLNSKEMFGRDIDISEDGNVLAITDLDRKDSLLSNCYIMDYVTDSWIQRGSPITGGERISLSGDGNTLVIYSDIDENVKIYNYSNDVWTLTQTITKTIVDDEDFANVVHIRNNVMVIGSGGHRNDRNSRFYIYRYNTVNSTWEEEAGPLYPAGWTNDGFNEIKLSYDEKKIVFSPMTQINANEDSGNTVYLFTYDDNTSQWSEDISILPSNIEGDNNLVGFSMDLSSDYIIVGDPGDDSYSGSVRIYSTDGDLIMDKIIQDDIKGVIGFGSSFKVSGDNTTLIVGGPNDNNTAPDAIGAVWIYSNNGTKWVQEYKIIPDDHIGFPRIGMVVDINHYANVIAFSGPEDNSGIGAIWIYEKINDVWTKKHKITRTNLGEENMNLINQGDVMSLSPSGKTLVYRSTWTDHADPNTPGNIKCLARYHRVSDNWVFDNVLYNDSLFKPSLPQENEEHNSGMFSSIYVWDDKESYNDNSDKNDHEMIVLGHNNYLLETDYTRTSNKIKTSQTKDTLTLPTQRSSDHTYDNIGLIEILLWEFIDNDIVITGEYNHKLNIKKHTHENHPLWDEYFKDVDKWDEVTDISDWSVGDKVSVSENGMRIFITVSGYEGRGAIIVYDAPNTDPDRPFNDTWNKVAVLTDDVNLPSYSGPSNQGKNSLSNDSSGNYVICGSITHNKDFSYQGAFWLWDITDIENPVLKFLSYDDKIHRNMGACCSMLSDGKSYLLGGNDNSSFLNYGTILYVLENADVSEKYDISLPLRYYSITDLVSVLNKYFVLSNDISVNAVFVDDHVEINIVNSDNYTTVFYIDSETTLDCILFLSDYTDYIKSVKIDFSLKKNIIKSIIDTTSASYGRIIDTNKSINYRKYEPGFTLKKDIEIDIQLRDDKERTIDLKGMDWIMTIYATIRN